MNELDANKYKWFIIPGFRSYEINIDTKQIRSNKHFNLDLHHIMNVKYGKVTITDDYGLSRNMKVDDLYILTFNMGNKLEFRADNWYHTGGMKRINRNFDIKMDYSKYIDSNLNKKSHLITIKPFVFDNDYNKNL